MKYKNVFLASTTATAPISQQQTTIDLYHDLSEVLTKITFINFQFLDASKAEIQNTISGLNIQIQNEGLKYF